MSTVNATAAGTAATAATTAANAATPAKTDAQVAQEASDRFLTLLVTQLKNQDPLNPLDNAQVTTQMAQISTVSGINKLNDTIGALAASMKAGEYLQAVGLVGHEVTVAGNRIELAEGKASYGMALATDAEAVSVTIKDAAGLVVRTVDLGAQKAGIRTFAWDGKDAAGKALAAGTYTIAVTATAAGAAVAADALTTAKVTGVAPTASGTVVSLGGIGNVTLADILQIH